MFMAVPFSKKLSKLFAGSLSIFQVLSQYVKPIVLLSLKDQYAMTNIGVLLCQLFADLTYLLDLMT